MGSETQLQQNPPIFNYGCWLTQGGLYNGCKMLGYAAVTS